MIEIPLERAQAFGNLARTVRFLLETDAGPVNPADNNRVVGAGAMEDVRRALAAVAATDKKQNSEQK